MIAGTAGPLVFTAVAVLALLVYVAIVALTLARRRGF
jgi:hypothetical protein